MKKAIVIMLVLCNTVLGVSQASINSKGFLQGVPNTVIITSGDTSAFALSIIARISQDTSFTRSVIPNEEIMVGRLLIRVTNTGNKSVQIKPNAAMNCTVTSTTTFNATNSLTVNSSSATIPNTDWVYLDDAINFTEVGDFQSVWLLDNTNQTMYEFLFPADTTTVVYNLLVISYL